MSGYSASAHIARTAAHVRSGTASRGAAEDELDLLFRADVRTADPPLPEEVIQVFDIDADEGVLAWLDRVRETWNLTTWYLFNSEGWR